MHGGYAHRCEVVDDGRVCAGNVANGDGLMHERNPVLEKADIICRAGRWLQPILLSWIKCFHAVPKGGSIADNAGPKIALFPLEIRSKDESNSLPADARWHLQGRLFPCQ